jgi:hypothetical protein
VKQIATHLPTKEEISSIEGFLKGGGDPTRLPNAEKFALEVSPKILNIVLIVY